MSATERAEKAEKARVYATTMNDRLDEMQREFAEQLQRRVEDLHSTIMDRMWEVMKQSYTRGYRDGFAAGVAAEFDARSDD